MTALPARATFLEGADRIGARLCRDALRSGDRCAWVTPSMEKAGGRWQVVERLTGPDLYGGTAGIGFFLAHLHAHTGEPVFARTAEAALNQALARLPGLDASTAASVYSGALGVGFAMAEMGRLTEESRWLEAACLLMEAQLHAPPDPRALDVIMGSAGAVPVLLSLAVSLNDPRFRDLAVEHGDVLLATARRRAEGWSWDTLGDSATPPLTGFAHGASGIAWALLELHHATGEGRYLEGALEGVRFESGLFDPARGNWPDLRDHQEMGVAPGTPVFGTAWCHGAPGIGLARLRGVELARQSARTESGIGWDTAAWGRDADAALRTTRAALSAHVHAAPDELPDLTLCHGLAGWTELCLMAERISLEGGGIGGSGPGATAVEGGEAGQAWERLLALHHDTGRPWPCGVRGGGEVPGLMLGTAGIGLLLLRMAVSSPPPPATMLGPGTLAACASGSKARRVGEPARRPEPAGT